MAYIVLGVVAADTAYNGPSIRRPIVSIHISGVSTPYTFAGFIGPPSLSLTPILSGFWPPPEQLQTQKVRVEATAPT